jgi:hypothetical protein
VVEKPDVIQITGIVGETEFVTFDGPIPEDIQSLEVLDKKERIRKAYLELRRMKSEKVPVDVVLGLDTFVNMIITSLNIPREAETGADLHFDITLQNVKTVKNQTVTIEASLIKPNTTATQQARPTANVGPSATTDETSTPHFLEDIRSQVPR